MLGKRTLAGQVNTKTASITDFKIDKAGPTINVSYKTEYDSAYTPGTWSNENVIITISLSDDGSGVSGSEKLNNINVNSISTAGSDHSYVTCADGKYESATVSCSDRAGNTTTVDLPVWVDTTPPSLLTDSDWTLEVQRGSLDWGSGYLIVKRGTVMDSTSGLSEETYFFPEATVKLVDSLSNKLGSARGTVKYDLSGAVSSGPLSRNIPSLDSGQAMFNVGATVTDVAGNVTNAYGMINNNLVRMDNLKPELTFSFDNTASPPVWEFSFRARNGSPVDSSKDASWYLVHITCCAGSSNSSYAELRKANYNKSLLQFIPASVSKIVSDTDGSLTIRVMVSKAKASRLHESLGSSYLYISVFGIRDEAGNYLWEHGLNDSNCRNYLWGKWDSSTGQYISLRVVK